MQAFGRLPEELVLHIFSLLDTYPPSAVRAHNEPVLGLTSSRQHDLKTISTVCQAWRRVVFPLLFRHCRLQLLGVSARPTTCALCSAVAFQARFWPGKSASAAPEDVEDYHRDMIEDAVRELSRSAAESDETPHILGDNEAFHSVTTWVPRFYHELQHFLDFLKRHLLASKVKSFMLSTERMLPEPLDRFPHLAAGRRDWRYRAVAAFWQHLLANISPSRVSILAPPIDLACLTLSAIDTFGDWAFGDMDYHLLTLEHSGPDVLSSPVHYDSLSFVPKNYPGVARSSILNLRQWDNVSLNEGSFLRAYGTYEYFEHGPPSLIHSINTHMSRNIITLRSRVDIPFHGLKKFTYTAIFPFANHLDFTELLGQIHELDLQLAPSPASNILDDKSRVGKAELADCWSELSHTYLSLVGHIATHHISSVDVPHLKLFICRDFQIPMLRDELDDIFTPLCLPVWGEYEQGVFTRIAPAASEAYLRI